MSCRIHQRIIDERSGRTVEELVEELERDYSPAAALSVFVHDQGPPAGTYVAECTVAGRLRTATLSYDGDRR